MLMAVNGERLAAIGAAIRSRSGESRRYSLSEMPDAIRAIGGRYEASAALAEGFPSAVAASSFDMSGLSFFAGAHEHEEA